MTPHGSGLDPANLWLRYQRYPFLLTKVLTFGLVAAAVYGALAAVQDVLTPVLLALFLAYLLDPAVDWFEARGFSRTAGIALFLWVGGGFLALFLLFLYPVVAHLIARITDGVPRLVDLVQTQALPWFERVIVPWLGRLLGMEMPSLKGVFDEFTTTLRGQLPQLAQRATKAIGDLWGQTGAIAGSLLNLVLVPVLTFYFLRDFDRMRLATVDYLPRYNRDWLLDRIAKMDSVVGAWFRGQIEVAVILSAMYALGLGLVFGMSGTGASSGVAIGLLAGILNIVPYFGFLTGFVMSVLLALLDWAGWMPLIGVLATFAIVQGLEGYVVTPRIVGEKVGLQPVVVIVALLLGGQVLGLLGVLLALPLAGIVRVLLPDLIAWYQASDLFTGELPSPPPPPDADKDDGPTATPAPARTASHPVPVRAPADGADPEFDPIVDDPATERPPAAALPPAPTADTAPDPILDLVLDPVLEKGGRGAAGLPVGRPNPEATDELFEFDDEGPTVVGFDPERLAEAEGSDPEPGSGS